MQYVLLVLDTPVSDVSSLQALGRFSEDVATILGKTGTVKMLNICCYQLNVSNGLNELSSLVALAKERRLPHRALFFENEPLFVVTKI